MNPILSEFGKVQFSYDDKNLKTKSFSPRWSGPEQYKLIVNNKTDIWSLGCVYYNIFTGMMPYHHLSENQIQKNPPFQNLLNENEKFTIFQESDIKKLDK